MSSINRRIFVSSLGLPALPLASKSFAAPSAKPLYIYVPAPPGGGTDMAARALGQAITKQQGRTVIIENRPGAFGMIAAQGAMRAPADGNTLLITHTAAILLPAMQRNLLVDVTREFQPVSMVCTSSNLLICPSKLGVRNLAEFLDWAKGKPDGASVGSFGTGSTSHINVELLKKTLQGKVTHIPFQGSSPLLQALIGGQLDAGFNERATMLGHVKNPAIKVLATTGESRSSQLPEVQTMKEAGYAGFEPAGFIALFAPAKVAPEVVADLSSKIQDLYQDEGLRNALQTLGFTPQNASASGLAELISRDRPKWESVIRDSNIRID
ncbi:tripartite tricarboxylate transporter substrate binding protein [Acidovorax sp. MR-S7]|uniref:Bug family tripartite tricarboxylate transporter substrate binding protein n=1 Tax=Acidovorax sp. MR-S7 TaxID=1268622 RepID=UPI0003A34A97|nr:tripartite tricarboxylate transporter substrate binding protein [Acidovorax sp. MR-S7]GAD24549.1 hypothetical protein AVS7_04309 [Acidovorax sp. MR-S7]